MGFKIAIDGPAGAGKSTIAKRVAKRTGAIYVDTGAMYRAMALFLTRNGISADDAASIAVKCNKADISIRYEDGEQIVLLNGENVNEFLRTEEVSQMASRSSAVPEVRAHLLDLQKNLAEAYDVVMDGRDIGTVILPDAQVKIFLTASAEKRARRRCDELLQKGENVSYEEVLSEIRERDARDSGRETAPLIQAPGAVLVDSSDLTIEEVEDAICDIVAKRKQSETKERTDQ